MHGCKPIARIPACRQENTLSSGQLSKKVYPIFSAGDKINDLDFSKRIK